ncbi:MAG: hypothetical protein ACT4NL_10460 [Pseudomarimonas sp.]
MTKQPQEKVKLADPTLVWAWGKSLGAATWPTLCALGFAVYAFFPERFPTEAGFYLCLLIPAEIPAIFIGVAQAAALAEHTLKGRLKMFFLIVGVAVVLVGIALVMETGVSDVWQLAPAAFWFLIPFLIGLVPNNDDPALVSRQAEAVLEDKLHLISLIPLMVIAAVLVAIGSVVLSMLISLAIGVDLLGKMTGFLDTANPSLFALFGSAYLLLGAVSAAHVHRPEFLLHRKALLDRPWINRLNPQKVTRERPSSRYRGAKGTPMSKSRLP